MPLQLFNTETRALQTVTPLDGKKVRFYTCGPTVYDFAHIGNFRTFIFEDILRRAMKFFGYEVMQVMNLTDVDDKTIRGSVAKKMSLNDFTSQYTKAFFEDIKTLNIEQVEHYPAATDYIPQMIEMIEELIRKGVAYVGKDGSVYFAIGKFPGYGKLSHLSLDELKVGASEGRRSQDEYGKENIADFVLWKGYDPERDGEVYWESPFGKGRPGWHLECSVMARAILGDTIDIHAGGVDLMFPHHENEIAQSESCTGCCFSKLWVHAEHLLVDNKKMSKSLGNFYTLRDLLEKGYSGKVIRYMLMQTHYRTSLNFTFQGLEGAKAAISRINDFIIRLEEYQGPLGVQFADIESFTARAIEDFGKALADDLNVPEALAVLFEMIRAANGLCDAKKLSRHDAEAILEVVKKMDSVLGVGTFTHESVPAEVQKLVDERQHARAVRDWKRSDEIRDALAGLGYVVEDTPSGSRVKRL
ncbi:MAG: cysteine--tRNA ligase [Verrucomicrobia bacterium]|nr:cysteine--tRNA ligase [Verrucomicrobiota bacterium]